MSKFKSRFSDQEIVNAIFTMDKSKLLVDDCLSLRAALPNEQERSAIELLIAENPNFSSTTISNGPQVARADMFLIECSREPNLAFMLDAFIFAYQYADDSYALEKIIIGVTKAVDFLRTDSQLAKLLGAVLSLGNLMNYEYSNSTTQQAVGFRLESLAKLKDVKSRDGKSTLMHYLIKSLEQSIPELLDISSCYSFLKDVRHLRWDDISAQVKELTGTLNQLRLYKPKSSAVFKDYEVKHLQPLVEQGSHSLELITNLHTALRESWLQTAAYLGEDIDKSTNPPTVKKNPEEVFTSLDYFFQLYDSIIVTERRLNESTKKLNETNTKPSQSPRFVTKPTVFVRDQMLDEIRSFKANLKAAPVTKPPQVDAKEECSECGLLLTNCDCSF